MVCVCRELQMGATESKSVIAKQRPTVVLKPQVDDGLQPYEKDILQNIKLDNKFGTNVNRVLSFGLNDPSLAYKMLNDGKTVTEIYNEWKTLTYPVLLMKYGRISGYPSYGNLVDLFVTWSHEPNSPTIENQSFIFGGLFPLPVYFDREFWDPYQLSMPLQWRNFKKLFDSQFVSAVQTFLDYYGLELSTEGIEIVDNTKWNKSNKVFSRFVRVTFACGIMGIPELFIRMKQFCFRIMPQISDTKSWENDWRQNRQITMLLLSRLINLEDSNIESEFTALKTRQAILYKNLPLNDIILRFVVVYADRGMKKTSTIIFRPSSKISDVVRRFDETFPAAKGKSWYLFDRETGVLRNFQIEPEQFTFQPACWESCVKDVKNDKLLVWFLTRSKQGKFTYEILNGAKRYNIMLMSSDEEPLITQTFEPSDYKYEITPIPKNRSIKSDYVLESRDDSIFFQKPKPPSKPLPPPPLPPRDVPLLPPRDIPMKTVQLDDEIPPPPPPRNEPVIPRKKESTKQSQQEILSQVGKQSPRDELLEQIRSGNLKLKTTPPSSPKSISPREKSSKEKIEDQLREKIEKIKLANQGRDDESEIDSDFE